VNAQAGQKPAANLDFLNQPHTSNLYPVWNLSSMAISRWIASLRTTFEAELSAYATVLQGTRA
jgi:hypothetical protein